MKRKKRSHKTDYMSKKMDKKLGQIEDTLTALYANTSYEVNAEFGKFMKQYAAKDEAMRALVESGEKTQEEYIAWRNRQILQQSKYKATVDKLTNMLVNTDKAAMAIVNGQLPQVVAESYNFVKSLGFAAAKKSGLTEGTFQVYNARTVQGLIKKRPDLLPKPRVDIPKDMKWNKDRITRELTQGILKGDSIPKIADRLQRVTDMDKNSAIRNARTAMTGAENMGRSEAAEDMRKNGVPVKEVWSAKIDARTRDTHLLLDGTYKDENGYFGVGIIDTPLRFAGDPAGDPEEVYNCRCRTSIELEGIDHSQDGALYEDFMKENYPEDYKALKESTAQQEKALEHKKTLEYQEVLKAINKQGYYVP